MWRTITECHRGVDHERFAWGEDRVSLSTYSGGDEYVRSLPGPRGAAGSGYG